MMECSNIVGIACDTNFNHSQPFNASTTKIIEDKTAEAASDAALKNGEMEGCWTMSDANYEIEVKNKTCHKR